MRSPGKGKLPQEQQTIITVEDLRVYDSANFDINICIVCMCVQNDKMSPFANNSCTDLETRHFSRFQNFHEVRSILKSANHDIGICTKVRKYIQMMISRNIKIYQDKYISISRYVRIGTRGKIYDQA